MKIIGKSERGYILECDPSEISSITGCSSDSSYHNGKFSIGCEIKVSENFRYLKDILNSREAIEKASDGLKSIADVMINIPELYKDIKKEEESK